MDPWLKDVEIGSKSPGFDSPVRSSVVKIVLISANYKLFFVSSSLLGEDYDLLESYITYYHSIYYSLIISSVISFYTLD